MSMLASMLTEAGRSVETAGLILGPTAGLAVSEATWAWWAGWSPTRAGRVVAGAWATAGLSWWWAGLPTDQVEDAYRLASDGRPLSALVTMAPTLIPLGLTWGAGLWARQCRIAAKGEIKSPRRAGQWPHRQFAHAMRRARREARKPGLVPTLSWSDDPVLGRVALRTEGVAASMVPKDLRLLTVPFDAIGRHLVVVGSPGAGKTVLLLRLMRGWLDGAWLRHIARGGDRPLLIFVDCKGGTDGKVTSEKFVGMCTALGLARGRVGVYPQTRLDLWSMPAERLTEVLVAMVKADHPFFEDMQDELIALAIQAPCGPPESSVDFVRRLNTEWLDGAWQGHPGELESIASNGQYFAGIAARYRGLFRRIGQQLDSGRHLDDYDALCVTLEGTANTKTASAQAQAVVELVTDLATRGGPSGKKRRVLFMIDEYSAVSSRVTISDLMERVRSLGIGVIVAGQSWPSLGPNDDERHRIVDAAAGGLLLMATPDPEKLAQLAGTAAAVETGSKRLAGGGWGDEGTGRAQRAMVVDPDWVRFLGRNPGGVVYVSNGQATWGQVAPAEIMPMGADQMDSGPLRRAVLRHRRTVVTQGPRLLLAELTAGLDESERGTQTIGDPVGIRADQQETSSYQIPGGGAS